MAKLRKMLGNINDPCIIALMRLIETQSQKTLANWAMDYVEAHVLAIYAQTYDKAPFQKIMTDARTYLDGGMKLKDVKPSLREANQLAKEAVENPVAQAAARALSTACATVQTPTNALGFTFYTAAAIVYHQAGLNESQADYDALAVKEFEKLLESLQAVAVPDEENPAKINWNC